MIIDSFNIENLKCEGCATSIRRKLIAQPGVVKVHIDADAKLIEVEHDGSISRKLIIQRLETLGYPLQGTGNGFQVAKSYLSCMIGRVNKT